MFAKIFKVRFRMPRAARDPIERKRSNADLGSTTETEVTVPIYQGLDVVDRYYVIGFPTTFSSLFRKRYIQII